MQEIITNSDEKTMKTLDADTFNAATELTPGFYSIPKNKSLLEEIYDFTKGHGTLVLLIGAKDSGKTTLLKSLGKKRQNTKYIQGQTKIDLFSIFIGRELGVDQTVDQKIEAILKEISSLTQESYYIIDDADLLDTESLQSLLTIFCKQPEQKFRLVLSGYAMLMEKIEAFCEKNNRVLNAETFYIKPLRLRETKLYIKKNLAHLLQKSARLTKKDIKQIHSISEGYPGRINRVFLQVAAKFISSDPPLLESKKSTSFVDVLLAIGIIFLVSVVGFRIFQLITVEHIPATKKPVAAIRKTRHLTMQAPPRMSQPEIKPALVADITPSFIASIENLLEENIQPVVENVPDTFSPQLRENVPDTFPSQLQQKSMQPAQKPVSEKVLVTAEPTKLHGFTLQLMAGTKKQSLVSWSRTMMIEKNCKIFDLKRHGKSWHVLTYGQFASYIEAKKAIDHLSQQLRSHSPWVRSMSAF